MMSSQAVLAKPLLALEHLDEIQSALTDASHLGLFLDFDGTLAPIVSTPDAAALDPAVRAILERLVLRPEFSVAIVSGRELSDLKERVDLAGVLYAGNHGLQIEANDQRFRNPVAESLRQELRCLHLQMNLAFSGVDGVVIEDKGLTLSVHYRQVQEELQEWVAYTTEEIVGRWQAFVSARGKKVVEARPKVDWNKGSAVDWILHRVLPAGTLPIYLGDDLTDEDAFAAIPHGITIRVGEPSTSTSRYSLYDVAAVGRFLDWLDHAKAHAAHLQSQHPGERPALV